MVSHQVVTIPGNANIPNCGIEIQRFSLFLLTFFLWQGSNWGFNPVNDFP